MSSAELPVFIDEISIQDLKKSVNKVKGIFCVFLPDVNIWQGRKIEREFIRRDLDWINREVIIKNNFGCFVKQPCTAHPELLTNPPNSCIVRRSVQPGR